MRGGRRSTSFKPGNKFGAKGRAKDDAAKKTANPSAKITMADVKAAAKDLSPKAMLTLEAAMDTAEAPWAAKVKAAETILDRGWGRPEQTVNANVSIFDQMSDDEQKHLLAALAALKAQDEDRVGTLN